MNVLEFILVSMTPDAPHFVWAIKNLFQHISRDILLTVYATSIFGL